MAGMANNLMVSSRGLLSGTVVLGTLALAGCGVAGNLLDKLPDATPDTQAGSSTNSAGDTTAIDERTALLKELQALRAELQKRSARLQGDLTAAKAELARRQGAGEINQAKVKLTPAQIRDAQLSELDQLKAELERRRSSKSAKQQAITTALTENEGIYRNIDACLTRPKGDFRGVFNNRPDLMQIVDEKDSQVYRNEDKSLLLLSSKTSCDISFTGNSINNFTTGLVHILETQGGVVESKKIAGLTVITVAHPRGNFRLASGRKIIGQGSATNLYTTITAL